MKRCILVGRVGKIFIVLFSLFVLHGVLAPAEAFSYSNAVDGFSASFPSPPTRTVQFNKSPVGKIKAHRYVAQDANGHFTIEVSQLPGIAVAFGGRKTIYRRAEKAFLKKTQSTKLASHWQKVQGIPVHQLSFIGSQGQQGEAWFLLVGKKLYVLVGKSQNNLAAVQAFLSSFRLTDTKA